MAVYRLPTCRKCQYPLKGLVAIPGQRATVVADGRDQPPASRQVQCPECGTVQAMVGLRPLPTLARSAAWCSAAPLAALILPFLLGGLYPSSGFGLILFFYVALSVGATCPVIATAVFEERYHLHPFRARVIVSMLFGGWAVNGMAFVVALYIWLRFFS